jgi:hypothetical protein
MVNQAEFKTHEHYMNQEINLPAGVDEGVTLENYY